MSDKSEKAKDDEEPGTHSPENSGKPRPRGTVGCEIWSSYRPQDDDEDEFIALDTQSGL